MVMDTTAAPAWTPEMRRQIDRTYGELLHAATPASDREVPDEARPRRVFWCMLMERNLSWLAVQNALVIAGRAARAGYRMIRVPLLQVDEARNTAVMGLLRGMQRDDDTLVMLDCDHEHPPDVIERLVACNRGVVGALAFRGSEPHEPMFWQRDANGELHTPETWPRGELLPATIVGSAAIAIQAWVFRRLQEHGHPWPWFRFEYKENVYRKTSEDYRFGLICEQTGIAHYCDTSLVTPHLREGRIDEATYQSYQHIPPERRAKPGIHVQVYDWAKETTPCQA